VRNWGSWSETCGCGWRRARTAAVTTESQGVEKGRLHPVRMTMAINIDVQKEDSVRRALKLLKVPHKYEWMLG